MKYARIRVTEDHYNSREKSLYLETIFGNVYAPKSKIIVENIEGDKETPVGIDKTHLMTILVPCWVFWNANLNPVQLEHGFVEIVDYDDLIGFAFDEEAIEELKQTESDLLSSEELHALNARVLKEGEGPVYLRSKEWRMIGATEEPYHDCYYFRNIKTDEVVVDMVYIGD